MFFAEREVSKIPGISPDIKPRPIERIGIVGAGTMGGGIGMAFANAGIPVTIIDTKQDAIDRGRATITKNYERSVARGRFTQAQMDERIQSMTLCARLWPRSRTPISFIEAVFENMELKKNIFKQLDAVAKPGAILATNTSTLDIDAIAAVTKRPQDVIGLHFFSPANVMRLLEIVRAAKTADDVLVTALELARKARKVGVVAKVCYGFIGNRIMDPYGA